jgi:oxalate---CoA ligase
MASNPLPPARRQPGSVGRATGIEITILGADGAHQPVGEVGEVAIRGATVFDGYEANPDANAAAFTDGWFRTGDEGTLDGDGYLVLRGRRKELINRGGEKIAPTEVERIIADHPAVRRVCVFGIPHPSLGEEVAAAVVPARDAVATERSIMMFARAQLADFKVPRRIVFTDDLPTSAAGKTDRRACARLYATQRDAARREAAWSVAEPEGVEKEIAVLWRAILKARNVASDSDLFLSGGDSLKIAELLVAIQQRFGVGISMREILDEGASVATMARLVLRAPANVRGAVAPPHASVQVTDGECPPVYPDIKGGQRA